MGFEIEIEILTQQEKQGTLAISANYYSLCFALEIWSSAIASIDCTSESDSRVVVWRENNQSNKTQNYEIRSYESFSFVAIWYWTTISRTAIISYLILSRLNEKEREGS